MRVQVKDSRPPPPRPATERTLSQNLRTTLEAIRRYQAEFGIAPSRMELVQRLGLRHQRSVDVRLQGLAQRGAIQLFPGVSRGIRVRDEGPQLPDEKLPVMDENELLRAMEIGEDEDDGGDIPHIGTLDSLAGRFAAPPEGFLLITEETAGTGYSPGDLVAISREREPQDGEGVVARIGGKIRLGSYRENQGVKEIQVEDLAERRAVASRSTNGAGEAEVLAIVVGGIITTGRVSNPDASQAAGGD